MKDKSQLIPYEKIKTGVYIAKDHAEYFLKMSDKLYHENEFQAAIPFAILAFEEASKINHLLDFIQDNKNIERDEWKELRNHYFKLTHSEKEIKNNLESQSDYDIFVQNLMMRDRGLYDVVQTKADAILVKQKAIEVQSKFSKIKEICFYANWNEKKNEWDQFQKIPTDEKKLLNLFIFHLVEHKLLLAKLSLEYMENPFTKPIPKSLSTRMINQYLSEKTKHDQNLQATKDMIEFEKKYATNDGVKNIQLGYAVFCKYFSN